MMSEEAELLRRTFERISRTKDPDGRMLDALDPETMAAIVEFFDPELEFTDDPRLPEADVYRGLDAVTEQLDRFTDSFDEFRITAEDFVDLGGGRVLLLFHLRTRGKGSGASLEARPGWIFTIRDGKATRIEAFLERSQALDAAGLGE